MLSIEKGNPIAKISGSKTFPAVKRKEGGVKKVCHKFLGLISPDDLRDNDKPGFNVNPYELIDYNELEKEAASTKPKKVNELVKERIKSKKKEKGREFILHDGVLEPTPDTSVERDVIYISGPAGAGKSTWVASYMRNYEAIFPDRNIYVFSLINDDPAFKGINNLVQIPLDNEYLDEVREGDGIEMEDLRDSMVVFDDVDSIGNKTMKEHIVSLRDNCLQIGRHYHTTTLCTTHQLCNYNNTKILIMESNKVVIFPTSGSVYHITRFLKAYCGLQKDKIGKVLNVPSRWAMIHKAYPNYILHSTGAFIL